MDKENYLSAVDTVCMNCAFSEYECISCPVRLTVDRMNGVIKHPNVKEFRCEELSQFIDSMLFDSGMQVAFMKYADADYEIEISLEVAGSVNVDYKGNTYRYPSDFPDELKEFIKTNNSLYSDDLYVDMNNWFEYIYDVKRCPIDKHKSYDGVVCESDLSIMTETDVLNEMLDIVHWIKNE